MSRRIQATPSPRIMKICQYPRVVLLLLLSPFAFHSSVCGGTVPTPTVLVTDIGGDVDDTWALAHILRSSELDLKMVLCEVGNPAYQASLTAKVLQAANRSDVQIAVQGTIGELDPEAHLQGPWVKGYDLSSYPGPVHTDGVQAFIDLVKSSPVPVTVIAIGPPPNLAQALILAPEIAQNCHFFGMYGSFDVGYNGGPEIAPETNVRVNVDAFRTVIAAAWKTATITPLDTCGTFYLEGENYHRIWSATHDPLLRAVIENYCIWAPRVPWIHCDYFATKSSTLFDDIAVYMAYNGDHIEYETITFSVTDGGYTLRDPDGPYTSRVAIAWKDKSAVQDFLTQRLLTVPEN
jgi:inosine-uridine nucleoside N-ribohydrolase